MAAGEQAPDLDLELVAGREADMAALGGHHSLCAALSHEGAEAKPRARPHHGDRRVGRPRRRGPDPTKLVVSGKVRRAQGLGGEVVDQPRGAETAVGAQPRLRQPPVGIGEVDGAVRHRPRHRQHHPLGPGAPGPSGWCWRWRGR